MTKTVPYPFGYPSEIPEEPTTKLDVRKLYEFHVTRAERAKEQCDRIIAHYDDKAAWDVAHRQTQLSYDAQTLSERYVANDLIFSKWSARYRFHEARATYLGQRVLLAQQDAIIKLLEQM
jgi:hypothetical protein